jgi:hypothetical protein
MIPEKRLGRIEPDRLIVSGLRFGEFSISTDDERCTDQVEGFGIFGVDFQGLPGMAKYKIELTLVIGSPAAAQMQFGIIRSQFFKF